MKLYISGGISGIPNYKERFATARKQLQEHGYEIEDPSTYGFPDDVSWEAAMKYDICRMLECDGVALLDGWEMSRGSCYEAELAKKLNMKVEPVASWLKEETKI